MVLLSFLKVLLKAKLMLYAVLHPRCTRPIFSFSRILWAESIALRFALVVSFFGQVGTFVIRGGDAVIKKQVVTFLQLLKRPSDVLLPC